jgi:predicted dehydrogenase
MTYQRAFKKRLNIAIVGVGSHAYRNILPALHHLPVRLVAVCDIDELLARSTAEEYGVKNIYTRTEVMYANESLDAVLICVGPRQHARLSIEALQAGVHVWMEKPPAMNVAELEEVQRHVRDQVVVVGFKKAFMPVATKAHELVQNKSIGQLATISAEYPCSIPENGGSVLAKMEFTDWLANGIHPISFMVRVGGKVDAVYTHRAAHGGGAVMLEYRSGVLGVMHFGAWGGYSSATERYTLNGTQGVITIENSIRLSLHRGIPFDYSQTTSFIPDGEASGAIVWEAQNRLATLENSGLFVQGMYAELLYFCERVLSGEKPEIGSLDFALDVMKIYEAGLRSHGDRVLIIH